MEFQRSIIVPAGKVITIYISNGGHTMSDNCVTLRQSFDDCPEGHVRLTAPIGCTIQAYSADRPCFDDHDFVIPIVKVGVNNPDFRVLYQVQCSRCSERRYATPAEIAAYDQANNPEVCMIGWRDKCQTTNYITLETATQGRVAGNCTYFIALAVIAPTHLKLGPQTDLVGVGMDQ